MTTIAQDLGGVVRLLNETSGQRWVAKGTCVVHEPDHGVYRGHVADCVEDDDAAFIAACHEFFRTHSAEIAGALRDADGWQPIESAPNGAWFLVHSERGWIGLARRADPDYAQAEDWFEDEHNEYINPAWLTHWRPLPAPPTQDSAMQQGGGGGDSPPPDPLR